LRHFFLFNDVLIYADPSTGISGTKYALHQAIPLNKCKIEDIEGDKEKSSFQVISSTKSFTVIAGTVFACFQSLYKAEYLSKNRNKGSKGCVDLSGHKCY